LIKREKKGKKAACFLLNSLKMSKLAASFQNIKNMLQDKITVKISELQTNFDIAPFKGKIISNPKSRSPK
jgi:hypothetical protein